MTVEFMFDGFTILEVVLFIDNWSSVWIKDHPSKWLSAWLFDNNKPGLSSKTLGLLNVCNARFL